MAENEMPDSALTSPSRRDEALWADYLARDEIKGLDPDAQARILARFADVPQPIGRRKGTDYGPDDAGLVDELERRIAAGENVGLVSRQLAALAKGGGTPETKAKRLRNALIARQRANK